MSTVKPTAWYAARYVERYGMAVIPLKQKSKLPVENDWGNRAITDADKAAELWHASPRLNIGLALGPSAMCSLDIDCMDSFRVIADEFGIDIDKELAAVPTIQGASKGMRCMFRVPKDHGIMDYHKINWPAESDPSGEIHRQIMRDAAQAKADGNTKAEALLRADAKKHAAFTVIELRVSVSGQQRFDALPPSIHPDTGQPYRWIVQPPKTLDEWPEPPAWLMAIWNAWESFKPQLVDACPWLPRQEPPPIQPATVDTNSGESPITAFNDANDLPATLERYGYQRKGKRYLSPHSHTGLAGVTVLPDGQRCYIHHASDPLCSDDSGKPVNPFDLFCHYDHSGDTSKAVKAAAEILGMTIKRAAPTAQAVAISQPAEVDTPADNTAPSQPFRPLGYNSNSYFYLPRGTEQVAEIRKGSHTSPAELMGLAALEWWEMAYPKGKGGGADWHAAANDCMRGCERRGIYSNERERGRGAWYDAGRSVLHLGDRLLVNGAATAIPDHGSEFIYTRQAPLEHGADAVPATDSQAADVANLFGQLNWHKPMHAELLAGWCLLAPICGSLTWRPHVWITAQRGAGKSWVQDNIIQPLLGPSAMMVQGSTTEAGLRQRVRHDSRPIVFDEAESEDNRSQHRMQTVIELARQASSDSSAEIVKGTVGGHAMSFRIRSMFLLGSVNVSLTQAADESRFSVLSLATPAKTAQEAERFAAFRDHAANTLTAGACAAIRARAYRLMPVIRDNAVTFGRAIAEVLGSQRLGDQVGTLLAGAYAYRSSGRISLEDARTWVATMDFSDAKEAESVSDEEACLQKILQHQIRFDSEVGHIQRSIGELVECASGGGFIGGLSPTALNDVLRRYGVTADKDSLTVANRHVELDRVFTGTPWAAGWRRILGRIDGATNSAEAVRFAGARSRAVVIPMAYIE